MLQPPPSGIRVIEHYLDIDQCRKLSEYANTKTGEPLTLVDVSKTTANNVVRKLDPNRVTEKVDLGQEQGVLDQITRTVLRDTVEPDLGVRIEWFEKPQLLRYRTGGLYKGHADSDKFDPMTSIWTKILDRDVSVLLYLNDEYTGGSLSFPRFRYSLQPKPGMLVFFPSHNRYYHSAEPVLSGIRYAMVSWAALHGVPKIHTEPPPGALFLQGNRGQTTFLG